MSRFTALVSVAALIALTTPAIGQNFNGGFQPTPATPTALVGHTLGSIEFMAGFAGEESIFPDSGAGRRGDLSLAMGIIPSVEQVIGSTVSIGAEMMFLWITTSGDSKEEMYAQTIARVQADTGGVGTTFEPERRLVLGPHGKIRMSFPLSETVTFDSMLAVGASILTEADDRDAKDAGNVRMGWSLRFGFGVSAVLNDAVSTFMSMGYYTSSSYGDALEYELRLIPLSAGLRANF